VRATPRAAADRVGPYTDALLQVRVTAPASEGRANDAVRRLLAGALDVAPSRVSLVAGERGRTKRFRIEGLAVSQVASRLRRFRPD
jgi:uncharacterized protein YggU (UPF0235/DUF167 family)